MANIGTLPIGKARRPPPPPPPPPHHPDRNAFTTLPTTAHLKITLGFKKYLPAFVSKSQITPKNGVNFGLKCLAHRSKGVIIFYACIVVTFCFRRKPKGFRFINPVVQETNMSSLKKNSLCFELPKVSSTHYVSSGGGSQILRNGTRVVGEI